MGEHSRYLHVAVHTLQLCFFSPYSAPLFLSLTYPWCPRTNTCVLLVPTNPFSSHSHPLLPVLQSNSACFIWLPCQTSPTHFHSPHLLLCSHYRHLSARNSFQFLNTKPPTFADPSLICLSALLLSATLFPRGRVRAAVSPLDVVCLIFSNSCVSGICKITSMRCFANHGGAFFDERHSTKIKVKVSVSGIQGKKHCQRSMEGSMERE